MSLLLKQMFVVKYHKFSYFKIDRLQRPYFNTNSNILYCSRLKSISSWLVNLHSISKIHSLIYENDKHQLTKEIFIFKNRKLIVVHSSKMMTILHEFEELEHDCKVECMKKSIIRYDWYKTKEEVKKNVQLGNKN